LIYLISKASETLSWEELSSSCFCKPSNSGSTLLTASSKGLVPLLASDDKIPSSHLLRKFLIKRLSKKCFSKFFFYIPRNNKFSILIVFDAEATYRTNGTSSLTKASGRIPGAKSFVSDSSFINTLQVTSRVCKIK
jgi:hypothetical protein